MTLVFWWRPDSWRFLGSWLVGKDEVLMDCPENEETSLTDKPIVHDYLHDEWSSFRRWCAMIGEISSTAIDNCVLYSAPDHKFIYILYHLRKSTMKMVKNGPLLHFDFEEAQTRLYHTWARKWVKEVVWVPLILEQPWANLVLWSFVDIKNCDHAHQPAFTCHGLPIYIRWKKISMIDPDYDSMADYVDVRSQMPGCFGSGQSPEQTFKIILVHACNRMLL